MIDMMTALIAFSLISLLIVAESEEKACVVVEKLNEFLK